MELSVYGNVANPAIFWMGYQQILKEGEQLLLPRYESQRPQPAPLCA